MAITLYSTEFCPWCHKTREFFKAHKVRFKEIDVGNNVKAAQEMIRRSGQQGVPVVNINGEIVVGYDEDRLKRLLKIKR